MRGSAYKSEENVSGRMHGSCVFCGGAEVYRGVFPMGKSVERRYWICASCGGIFCDKTCLPSLEDEKKRYLLHENGGDKADYVALLEKFVSSVLNVVSPSYSTGVLLRKLRLNALDFGCGPSPVLLSVLRGRGFRAYGTDPLFFPDVFPDEPSAGVESIGGGCPPRPGGFDFVFCHECAEHFHLPLKTFARMASFLKSGGICAVSTYFLPPPPEHHAADEPPPGGAASGVFPPFFKGWWYRMDFTHVSFYTYAAMEKTAATAGLKRLFPPGGGAALDTRRLMVFEKS